VRLYAWRPPLAPGGRTVTNFGDELNRVLWPALLGDDAFDDDPEVLFLGIGSLLGWPKQEGERIRIVVGTGAMSATAAAGEPLTTRWRVHCVRGPLTAHAYGLDDALGIADPGILAARLLDERDGAGDIGYMPHLDQAVRSSAALRATCADLGLRYIDPRDGVRAVIAAIASLDRLVTEAMHGAIVADSLRVPWVPVYTGLQPHRFKWTDWCASMDLEYRPVRVPDLAGWAERRGLRAAPLQRASTALFADRLRRIAAGARPMLSADRVLDDRLTRLESVIAELRAAFDEGTFEIAR
jgi:succinoglycan biosynthesis protein ExoV